MQTHIMILITDLRTSIDPSPRGQNQHILCLLLYVGQEFVIQAHLAYDVIVQPNAVP